MHRIGELAHGFCTTRSLAGGALRTLPPMSLRIPCAVLALVAACCPGLAESRRAEGTDAARARVPVVLVTDIGSDIDDTWALAQVLRSPELDLKFVLTETGEARYRAALVAKLLEVAGRTDIPVGLGRDFGPMADDKLLQKPWLRGYELARFPGKLHEDGLGAFIELVMTSPQPLTVIAVGPVPSLAAALVREPRLAARCRLVGMFGSFHVGYDGAPKPAPEYNVYTDVPALRTVLAAPWQDILITPLDTCGTAIVSGDDYHRLWSATGDPLLRAVIENYCAFAARVPWMHCDFFATRSTVLFDCVAVYLSYSEELVEVAPVAFRVDDNGATVPDPAGSLHARVALRWKNLPGFTSHLTARLLDLPAVVTRP